MGNIVAGKDGVGKVDMKENQVTLLGEHSVVGRSVVVRTLNLVEVLFQTESVSSNFIKP